MRQVPLPLLRSQTTLELANTAAVTGKSHESKACTAATLDHTMLNVTAQCGRHCTTPHQPYPHRTTVHHTAPTVPTPSRNAQNRNVPQCNASNHTVPHRAAPRTQLAQAWLSNHSIVVVAYYSIIMKFVVSIPPHLRSSLLTAPSLAALALASAAGVSSIALARPRTCQGRGGATG